MREPVNPAILGAHLLGEEEIDAATQVLRRRQLFRFPESEGGSENTLFEKELGSWLNVARVCTVSSGTAGLRAALQAVGVRPGDLVLVSAYTFIATASAVLSLGAHPHPIDLSENLGMDLVDLEGMLRQAKAIVPVYVPGHASNVEDVVGLARELDIPVIEDSCQALGVFSKGRAAGTIGTIGVYSFQQGKQLCAGEGGAVVSSNDEVLARVRRQTDHGAFRLDNGMPTWEPKEAGFGENLRLTELQAAVLRVQLSKLQLMIELQRSIRAELRAILARVDVKIVDSCDPAGDSGSNLLILMPSAKAAFEIIAAAGEKGLLVRWPWQTPFCDTPQFRRIGCSLADSIVPRARDWSGRLITIPIPPLSWDSEARSLLTVAERVFMKRRIQ